MPDGSGMRPRFRIHNQKERERNEPVCEMMFYRPVETTASLRRDRNAMVRAWVEEDRTGGYQTLKKWRDELLSRHSTPRGVVLRLPRVILELLRRSRHFKGGYLLSKGRVWLGSKGEVLEITARVEKKNQYGTALVAPLQTA